MRSKTLNEMLGTAIADLVLEKNEDNKNTASKEKKKKSSGSKISDAGAYGTGGRFGGMIEDFQRSRANRDPRSLMKDLGVSSATGNDDLSKASSVLEQAINRNEIMKRAFTAPALQKSGDNVRVKIAPATSDLTARVATKYLHLTLIAAENAGILRLEDGVKFLPLAQVGVPTLAPM